MIVACTSSVPVLPTITDSVCHLKADCTSVECCTDIGFLQRTFKTSVTLDPCNFLLTVSIERMTREITLTGYSWGTGNFVFINVLKRLFKGSIYGNKRGEKTIGLDFVLVFTESSSIFILLDE